jgi:hypothetical protein
MEVKVAAMDACYPSYPVSWNVMIMIVDPDQKGGKLCQELILLRYS